MTGWKSDMIGLADYAFRRLRTRLVGLTDEEYLWEPVPGCWTLGEWQDGVWPTPFTTLAWRLTHMINNLNDPRYTTVLGLSPRGDSSGAPPTTAAEALDRLDRGWQAMCSYLEDLDEDSLTVPMGPAGGPWATDDRGAFVLHMLDELIHHGAEIALLRDLFRSQQPPNPAIDVLLTGDRDAIVDVDPALVDRARAEHADLVLHAAGTGRAAAIPVLVALGFPMSLPDATSALHWAAGAGDAGATDALLALGADLSGRDAVFRATPAEWADYFGHRELAERLHEGVTRKA